MEQDLGITLVGTPRRLLHVDRFRSRDLAAVYLRCWRGNDWKVGLWNWRAVGDDTADSVERKWITEDSSENMNIKDTGSLQWESRHPQRWG